MSLPASFNDWMQATRDVRVLKTEDIHSVATKNTYAFSRMIEGEDIKKFLKGGEQITDYLQTTDGDTYSTYDPGGTEQPVGKDVDEEVKAPWTFNRDYWVYDEEELDTNQGDEDRFYDLRRSKELRCLVSMLNGVEEQLFATPDNRTMEDGTTRPRDPYSILSFVTRDGQAPSSTNGGVASGSSNWTTVEQLSDTTHTNWQNATATYTASTPDDPDDGLLKAMGRIVRRVKYEMPTKIRRYTDPANYSMRKQVIFTSEDGEVFFEARLRQVNDRMRLIQDPDLGDLQYRGIPIEYIAELDNAGWTTDQPDYLVLNFNNMFPVFKTNWFITDKITDGGSTQPNRHVVWKFLIYNLFCNDRRSQGRVSAA